MKKCTRCKQVKMPADFYMDRRAADGRTSACKRCEITRTNTRRKENLQENAAAAAKWKRANPEKCRAWVKANLKKCAEKSARWAKAHPAKCCAFTMARKAAQLCATPAWANQLFIEEIYDLAQLRTKLTGIPWEVDHVVPLKSPRVCGLHVENNLRVIPAVVNQQKGNRHWPDMPKEIRCSF